MEIHYDAFISYRHAKIDTEAAVYVQHWLEHFHVPGPIRKFTGKKRISRIFRDSEELPLTSNIGDDIKYALNNSEYLIVICSPRTKESEWVSREINEFLRTHDENHVLTVLAEGDPYEVIPERLTWKYEEDTAEDGTRFLRKAPLEPLSCDLRIGKRQASRVEMPRLAAALLGVPYDTLVQRYRQYRLRIAMTLSSVIFAAMMIFSIYVWRSNVLIKENYRQALINQSAYLAAESETALENGDRMTAIRLALAALPEEGSERPVLPLAVRALLKALPAYVSEEYASSHLLPDASYLLDAPVKSINISSSEEWLAALDDDNNITIWNTMSGTCSGRLNPKETTDYTGTELTGFIGDADFVFISEETIYCCSLPSLEIRWKARVRPDGVYNRPHAMILNSQDRILVSDGTNSLHLLSAADGSILDTFTLEALAVDNSRISTILEFFINPRSALSDDDRYAAFEVPYSGSSAEGTPWSGYTIVILDLEKGSFRCLPLETQKICCFGFVPGNQLAAAFRDPEADGTSFMNGELRISTSRDVYTLWNPVDGKMKWEQEGTSSQNCLYDDVFCLPFIKNDGTSTDSVILVYSSLACVLDKGTGELLCTAELPGSVLECSYKEDTGLILVTDSGNYVTLPLLEDSDWTARRTLESELSDCWLGEQQLWTVTGNLNRSDPSILEYSFCVTDDNWEPLEAEENLSYVSSALVADEAVLLAGYDFLLVSDGQKDHALTKVTLPVDMTRMFELQCALTKDHSEAAVWFPGLSSAYMVRPTDGSVRSVEFVPEDTGTILDTVFLNDCFWYLQSESNSPSEGQTELFLGMTGLDSETARFPVTSLETEGEIYCSLLPGNAGDKALVFLKNTWAGDWTVWLADRTLGTAGRLSGPEEYLKGTRIYDPSSLFFWSPDDTRIALLNGDSVIFFDNSGTETSASPGSGSPVSSITFSPDGGLITLCEDSRLRKYTSSLKQEWILTLSIDTANALDYSWNWTENGFLTLCSNNRLIEIDVDNQLEMAVLEGCFGFQPGAGRFVCEDLSGYGFRERYTLERLMEKGRELLLDFEMTDLQKAAYGLSDQKY